MRTGPLDNMAGVTAGVRDPETIYTRAVTGAYDFVPSKALARLGGDLV